MSTDHQWLWRVEEFGHPRLYECASGLPAGVISCTSRRGVVGYNWSLYHNSATAGRIGGESHGRAPTMLDAIAATEHALGIDGGVAP